MENSILSNTWTLWFHKINDSNWDKSSYVKIHSFKDYNEYLSIVAQIKDYTHGMFFLMKDDIFPSWESPKNIKGGYWSFKVYKINSQDAWQQLSFAMIGNTLCKDTEDMKYINGISISPKYSNCIIKIWNSDYTKDDKNILNDDIPQISIEHCIYKKYEELEDFKKIKK